MSELCANCKHWNRFDRPVDVKTKEPVGELPQSGFCRRFPRVPFGALTPSGVQVVGNLLPTTGAAETCGEFKSKVVAG